MEVQETDSKSLNVVLVEDNPADVYLLQLAMAHVACPCNLTVATDGISAWQYLEELIAGNKKPPDLLILDLNLPGLSGRQILQRLGDQNALTDLPILVFSGSTFEQSVVEDFPGLHLAFEPKTPDFAALCDIVRRFPDFMGSHQDPQASGEAPEASQES